MKLQALYTGLTFLGIVVVFSACAREKKVPEEKTQPAASQPQWKSDYVTANGIRMHYWRTGGAKPAMVLVHGYTDNGLCWTSLARKLQDRFDVVMYDVRGHGYSDKPAWGYDMETLAQDLVALIQALGLQKPILMGHSMGAAIVAAAAAMYPDLPRAVILEDPVFVESRQKRSPKEVAEIREKRRKEIEERRAMTRDQLIELAKTKLHPGWPEEDYGPWADAKLQVSPEAAAVVGSLPDLREYFPKITVPTLILKADADEEQKKRNLEVARLLPKGKLVHIAGAGHNVRRDKPAETLQTIQEFLAGI